MRVYFASQVFVSNVSKLVEFFNKEEFDPGYPYGPEIWTQQDGTDLMLARNGEFTTRGKSGWYGHQADDKTPPPSLLKEYSIVWQTVSGAQYAPTGQVDAMQYWIYEGPDNSFLGHSNMGWLTKEGCKVLSAEGTYGEFEGEDALENYMRVKEAFRQHIAALVPMIASDHYDNFALREKEANFFADEAFKKLNNGERKLHERWLQKLKELRSVAIAA